MKLSTLAATAALTLFGHAVAASVPVFKNLEDFDRCVRDTYNSDRCGDGLNALVRKTPSLALDAGKRARRSFHASNAVPYFAIALRERGANAVCGDQDAQLATVAGLALPGDYPLQASSAQLFDTCYAAMLPMVKAELATSFGGYLERNVCATLVKRGDSSPACAPKAPEAPAVAAAPAPLPKLDAATAQLERVKVYRGPEGERVSIALVQGQNDLAVVRFDNVTGPWNGRALLHRISSSRQGENAEYTTDREGKPWTSVVKRGGSYSVYVPGQPQFGAGYSDTDSSGATTRDLLKALQ